MKTYLFNTNINCGGCIAAVAPGLNTLKGVDTWDVDINDTSKILKVTAQDFLDADAILEVVKAKGFEIVERP